MTKYYYLIIIIDKEQQCCIHPENSKQNSEKQALKCHEMILLYAGVII